MRIRSDFCGWSNASSEHASRIAPARSSMFAVATAADSAPLLTPSTHVFANGHCVFTQSTAACRSTTCRSDIRHSRSITGLSEGGDNAITGPPIDNASRSRCDSGNPPCTRGTPSGHVTANPPPPPRSTITACSSLRRWRACPTSPATLRVRRVALPAPERVRVSPPRAPSPVRQGRQRPPSWLRFARAGAIGTPRNSGRRSRRTSVPAPPQPQASHDLSRRLPESHPTPTRR